MKTKIKLSKTIYLLLLLPLIFLSCNDDDDDNGNNPEPNSVRLSNNATFGQILTDSDGNSLYFFSLDTKDTSECLGGCLDVWPVFFSANLTVDSGLNIADFATINRTDGAMQTTYQGWPLYYFANDVTAGDTNGDQANDIWYIAKPDYSLMYVSAQLIGHDGNNYLSDYTVGDGSTFYITDIDGNTLYTFINDTNNTNNFTANDFSNNSVWPIAEISLDKIPSILNSSDFGTIDVFGRTQLTFRGWPLYYFGQDSTRGDNKGISFPVPGVWPIANINTTIAPQ